MQVVHALTKSDVHAEEGTTDSAPAALNTPLPPSRLIHKGNRSSR